jgi:Fe-S cluster assembly scaffold protein SufB
LGSKKYFFGPFADFRDQSLIEHSFATLLSPLPGEAEKFLLHIPRGVRIAEPIALAFEAPTTHLLAIVEQGARASIVEVLKNAKLKHGIELFVEDDAHVDFVSLQSADPTADVWIGQRSQVGSSASVAWRNVTLGGREVYHDLHSRVAGTSGTSSIDWIFCGKETEKQTLSARNVFDAPHGSGEVTVHGVVEEKAHAVFKGMIEITPRGAGTDTYLTEKTLMLDPTAKVDAVPALEIKTNDVKASHSATVTKVSNDDLFYLASRGIPESFARHMIIEGFLGALVERFPQQELRALVRREIARKFGSASLR